MEAPTSNLPNPQELIEKIRKNSEDESLWKKVKDDQGVEIFEGKDSGKYRMFRGVGYIDKPLAELIPLVKNKEHRKKWNEAYIDTDLIEDKAEYKIMRPMFKAGATATNRDFCVFFASYESETEFVDAQTSIEDSRCPPTKSFVRGTCFFSGTRMIAESSTRTKVFYVGQLDLGGWVPAFIGNSINLKQPLCIAKIRDYSAKLPAEKQ